MATKLVNSFVAQSIPKLYLNDDFADFTFTFGNDKVPVHRNILAVANPVFCAMFFGQIKDKVSVEITDSYADAFKEFLQFFYLGEVTLTMENIEEVMKLADKYDMLDCVNTCAAFLEDNLTEENVLLAYKLAVSLKNDKLKQFCEVNVRSITNQIFETEAFLRCDRDVLKSILQMDSLAVDETKILKACLSWARNACQLEGADGKNAYNLRNQLGDCLHSIRFAAMTMEAFVTNTEPYKGLLTADETAEIVHAISVPDAKSVRFLQMPRLDSTKAKLSECKPRVVEKSIEEDNWLCFSVNVPALLGELHAANAYDGMEDYAEEYPFILTIGELADVVVRHDSSAFKKVLFKEDVNLEYETTEMLLPPILVVQPGKTYAIRFEQVKKGIGNTLHGGCGVFRSQYKLNDGLVVSFEKMKDQSSSHPSLRFSKFLDRLSGDLCPVPVSSISFRRI